MSRYRKPVYIPRLDEEPDFDTMPSRRYNDIDFIIDEAFMFEREQVGGYYDGRRRWKVA